MNPTEAITGIAPETRFLRYLAGAEEASGADCPRQVLDAASEAEEPSEASTGLSALAPAGDIPCEDAAEGEVSQAEGSGEAQPRRPDPNAPTAAEVGAHFAAEIADNADGALQAAARLGPRRVLALLT